jgi:hypothetical protein
VPRAGRHFRARREPLRLRRREQTVHQDFAYLGKWLGGPTNLQRSQRPSRRFLTKGAGVQTGMHRVLLLWSRICNAGHVLQLRRGAGVQKFATARWLVNGCQSTPTVHIRKWKPSASAKPKVRDNRMNRAGNAGHIGNLSMCKRVQTMSTGIFGLGRPGSFPGNTVSMRCGDVGLF